MKVYYQGVLEIIDTQRDLSYSNLLEVCLHKFGVPSVSGDKARLRSYDPLLKVRMMPVPASLESLLFDISSMHSYRCYDLETSDSNGGFEDCTNDTIYLKVCVHDPAHNYDFTDMSALAFCVVKTSLQDTVEDLEQKVHQETGIPLARLVIMLRHENVNNTVRCEYFNLDWRQKKRLQECSKLEHGWTLFVEDADPKQSFDLFKWKQEFSAEVDRVTLLLNDPKSDPDADSYRVKVICLRTSTLQEFKDIVGQKFDLPIDAFYMIRAAND